MRVMVRQGDDLIRSEEFDAQRIDIGSDKACAIHLPDSRVLARQAALVPGPDGTWMVENAADHRTTFLNGRPVIERASIKHGDDVTIFNFTISVYRSSGEKFAEQEAAATMVTEEAKMLRTHPLAPGALVKHSDDPLTLSGAKCRALSLFTADLCQCTDIPKLIDFALESALDAFGARLAFVGIRRNNYGRLEFVQGRNIEGKIAGEPPGFESYRYRCLEAGQFICVPRSPERDVGSVLAVPLSCDRGVLGLLYVDRKPGADMLCSDDLDRLTAIATLLAGQIERIVLGQLRIQESVQEGQLTFVREIQTRMDPTTVPQWDGLQLAVYCKPGLDRSGDVFDVMRLPNGLAAVLVANLSGESTRCALAMAEARAAFRVAGLHADPPHVFLRSFNWMLHEDRAPCEMQAAMTVMNPKTGAMEYSTAGDIGALYVNDRGECQKLVAGDSPAVGTVRGHGYGPTTARIGVGETLALFTAGCFTVCDSGGAPLGARRFVESIADGFGQSANVALDELLQDHSGFFKDGRQPDDITILLFHRVAASA